MCGIAGYIGNPERAVAEQRVRAMIEALAHRGPDGEGIHSWPAATFGHRRLSIFDLSEAGRQPMLSPDGQIGVVFNGAIYNFHALRSELEKAGYTFTSQTDTEVLVHGYREWGIDALVGRCRGMFAFAIWDNRTQTAYLVRDRLGVKPLIYSSPPGALAFASTPRALRTGGFVAQIDPVAVTEYLEFGYITDDRTIYAGATKLPPATILEWHNGETHTRKYWLLPEATAASGPTVEEAVEETERLLLEAVRLRLEADVPVGSLLSGGIDSALVCWAVAKLGADITAFTVGTPGDAADETLDATATARHIGIRHEVIHVTPDQEPDITELISAYGEPFACASALGMLRVSRAVKRSATVLLTGDGGDDVFLGYPEHRHFLYAQRLARKIPRALAQAWGRMQHRLPRNGVLQRPMHFIDYAAGGLGAVAVAHDGLQLYQKHRVLGERLNRQTLTQRAIPWSPASARNLLSEFLRYDYAGRFVAEYMTKVDGGAMWHALEARSPFLDQELWNFAARLPFSVRLGGGTSKRVLRELARRRVGERVAYGRKRGFTIPVEHWLTHGWRGAADQIFHDSMLARNGWLDREALLTWWGAVREADRAPKQFWYLFVLESWLRHEATFAARSAA